MFQFESGVDLTGEGSNDGNGGADSDGQLLTRTRDAFVGLSSPLGQLVFGRVGGLNQWVYDYNLFADQVGDLGNIWGGTGLAGRVDSSIHYTSPNLAGASLKVVYAPEEDTEDTEVWVVKGDYQGSGPLDGLTLGAAFMSQGTGPGSDEQQAVAVTGSYALAGGAIGIGGGFQHESDIAGVSGEDRDSFTVGGSLDLASLGGTERLGRVKAQFVHSSGEDSDQDAFQWAVGYDHPVADNATLYIAYAAVENDSAAQFSANNYGHGDAVTPSLGEDPWVVSFGFVYSFRAALWPR